MKIFKKIRAIYRIAKKQYDECPSAFTGKNWSKYVPYPETFYPQYEDNTNGVLHVCICDKCEDAKPRLKELVKDFRCNILYKDEKNNYVQMDI